MHTQLVQPLWSRTNVAVSTISHTHAEGGIHCGKLVAIGVVMGAAVLWRCEACRHVHVVGQPATSVSHTITCHSSHSHSALGGHVRAVAGRVGCAVDASKVDVARAVVGAAVVVGCDVVATSTGAFVAAQKQKGQPLASVVSTICESGRQRHEGGTHWAEAHATSRSRNRSANADSGRVHSISRGSEEDELCCVSNRLACLLTVLGGWRK
jgi:hypothetical protein